jgi:hypothetical protein
MNKMRVKNAQLHVFVTSEFYEKLKMEAQELELTLNELCRRKLINPPVKEEILILRQFMEVLKK